MPKNMGTAVCPIKLFQCQIPNKFTFHGLQHSHTGSTHRLHCLGVGLQTTSHIVQKVKRAMAGKAGAKAGFLSCGGEFFLLAQSVHMWLQQGKDTAVFTCLTFVDVKCN